MKVDGRSKVLLIDTRPLQTDSDGRFVKTIRLMVEIPGSFETNTSANNLE